ncbi:hypothetical protein HY947_00360 [Candidatus Gottesmanbacteria bacterium]|nr:hypothetical protein [Candidatus Gottesmanbacteria bacterium]
MNSIIKTFRLTVVLCICSFLLGVFVFSVVRTYQSSVNASAFADMIIATCASRSYKPACYDEEIPKLMKRPYYFSMEKVFEVTSYIQKKDPSYLYCHVLGHRIAENEVERNPDSWKEVVARCPTTMCNNGCAHGALMKRFQSEYLTDKEIDAIKNDLLTVCEPRGSFHPAFVERSMCYHSLGHLFMYITRADMEKSVTLCAMVGSHGEDGTYTQTCTEGVFMSVYQPLEPEDIALIKGIAPLSKTDSVKFCHTFTNEIRDACMRESWPLWGESVVKPEGLLSFCQMNEGFLPQKRCVGTVMNFVTVRLIIDNKLSLGEFERYCTELPDPWGAECFARGAGRLVQIDPVFIGLSLDLCDLAENKGEGDACFEEMLSVKTHNFSVTHPAPETFCVRFPQRFKSRCEKL